MPRKKIPEPKASEPKPAFVKRWFFQGLLFLVVVAAFLAGLILLGRWGLEQLRGRDRYAVVFTDIDCTPPSGLTRSEFLDEVQYLSRLPGRLGLLDDDLAEKLTGAFARHPWVEQVDSVMLTPPRRIEVKLLLRRPVLAVRTKDGLVAVDRHGVRLPKNARTDNLPVFEGEAAPPQGAAGTKWGDPKVEERARRAQ